jgi:fido (protein-threonine AMPylation protein)
VAACYFPTTEKGFKDVREKFEHDFEGVARNSARGIAFFTNQHLTPSEREAFEKIARDASASARIYHVEAIRVILDSPRGYGMRLEYLRIPMKPEEQASFISQFGSDLSAAMERHSDVLVSISKKVGEIHAAIVGDAEEYEFHQPRLAATIATRAMISELVEASDKSSIKAKTTFITQHLGTELLCCLHRSMLDEAPGSAQSGRLRSVGVWIGAPGSTPEHARYIPPKPEEVPELVNALLTDWRANYENTIGADQPGKINRIVSFHHEFLRIHPFLDGNGRLARLIMEQQARELLNIERRVVLEDSTAYFEALQKAHTGETEPLRVIITQALLGSLNTEG